MKHDFRDLHPFVVGYVTAMFWTEQPDEDVRPGEFTKNYDVPGGWDTFSEEEQNRIVAACSDFARKMAPFLTAYPDEEAGHDFWLTRNGHGCGFWENDYGSPEDCEALTEESRKWGEAFVSFDEGKWYYDADWDVPCVVS